jgi:hypothetical protein
MQHHSLPLGLFNMAYRAPQHADATKASVTGSERPFVCLDVTKVGLKSTNPIELAMGQHYIVGDLEKHCSRTFEIFHVPIRSRDEIAKRALNYEPRWALSRTSPDEVWQSAHHRNIVLSGRLDAEWAANSFDTNGCLDVYGRPLQLTRDARLRYILAKAATYFISRYGMWVETRKPHLDAETTGEHQIGPDQRAAGHRGEMANAAQTANHKASAGGGSPGHLGTLSAVLDAARGVLDERETVDAMRSELP